MEYIIMFIIPAFIGAVALFAYANIYIYNSKEKMRLQYGFTWFRYKKDDFVHKYVGDYLYVCERVPFLDNKLSTLPKEEE